MNTKSALVRSIGALLALFVFVSLPTTLLAVCYPTHDPLCELYYGSGTQLFLELETDCPINATLFVITSIDQPIPANVNPCHTGSTPCSGTSALANGTKLSIPYGHTLWVKMVAWRSDSGDSSIVSCDQHNPNW